MTSSIMAGQVCVSAKARAARPIACILARSCGDLPYAANERLDIVRIEGIAGDTFLDHIHHAADS